MNFSSADIKFMRRALSLARKGKGRTSPNPMVGCVIAKAGKIIAEGWHKFCGGDHAEVAALKKAGAKAKGATMYVTLDPCSHWGRTPPCTDAILKAKVGKVIVATTDPNPVNNGKSLKLLKKAGVDVMLGVCQHEAEELNAPFIKYITKNMPFVVAKSAQTLDGKIATRSGDSKWITSEETRTFARKRRDEFDAILVGVNTVIVDDPRLEAPSKRIWKIILDSTLRTPERARIFSASEPGQVIIATTKKRSLAAKMNLEKAGARIIVCPVREGKVDLRWLFRELAGEGIASILIEGGASVIGGALKARLVDRLHAYIAPKIVGDSLAKSSVVKLDVMKIASALRFEIGSVHRIGKDVFIELCSPIFSK